MGGIRLAILVAVLCAFAVHGQTLDDSELLCESALQSLVKELEAENQFSDAKRVEKLPAAETGYSACVVPRSHDEAGERLIYVVSRHSDNVTVFVHRQLGDSRIFVVYGPFYSAYRK